MAANADVAPYDVVQSGFLGSLAATAARMVDSGSSIEELDRGVAILAELVQQEQERRMMDDPDAPLLGLEARALGVGHGGEGTLLFGRSLCVCTCRLSPWESERIDDSVVALDCIVKQCVNRWV